MTTLRPLTEDGFGPKRVAVVGEDGQPLRMKSGKIAYRLWAGEKQEFLEQRNGSLDLQNQHLALHGHEIRVDGRSYAERGIDVVPTTHIGVAAKAIQRRAEREGLEKEAGIQSRTLASWELRWKRGRNGLNDRTVFVLDEAGMVASRQMALFIETASKAGAKIVLVGDPEQLQPIEAGAAFRAIVERIGYAELETIYRQGQQWMRDASLDLARGRTAPALSAYRDHGRLFGSELKAQAIDNLIADWNRDYDPSKSTLILAHLRRDFRALNEMARAKLVERGLVAQGHAFRTEDGQRRFAPGDQIVFLKNEGSLGVKNGMIGKVVESEPKRWSPRLERARAAAASRSISASIAMSTTATRRRCIRRRATVDRVKVLATLSLDKHLTYVALTRHREDVALYYGRRSFQKAGGLIPILSQRRAKETTLDYERGSLYRDALRFAANRGLHIVRVARTLMSDRLRWTVRQKQRLTEVGRRLRALGAKLGLVDGRKPIINTAHKEAKPMVTGVTTFPKISHRHRRGQNAGGPRHQEAVGGCLHPLPPRLCRSPAGVQGDELRRHAEGSGRCEHDARVHRRNPGIIRRAAWKKRSDGRQGGQGGTPARRRQCAGAPARHRALLTSSRRGRAQARSRGTRDPASCGH
ncbi:hypothetical protein ACVWZ6_001810 [Bradyrhizobium sp. GM6.1]